MNARGSTAVAVAVAFVVAACGCATASAAPKAGKLKLQVLSSDRDLVTGEDALIAVDVPRGTKPAKVRVRRNGRNVTSAFATQAGNGRRLVGLVEGLRGGSNLITAYARGMKKPGNLALFNSPITGPLFSGPHQSPFFCRTVDAGLGPATDANCSASSKVDYVYRTSAGTFKPLADPAVMPPDGVQTTTRDGQTVDYVVRIESGVINRSIYRWAILAPGGQTGDGWNERLVYSFGGGCDAGYEQGSVGEASVLDDGQLSRGYSVLSGSLNVLGTACNDVVSAESAAMLKEHVVESLGERPAWTIGEGGSGGSVQVHLLAQNYPGLLDGILPSASVPDIVAPDFPDCRLLAAYYSTPEGAALTDAQREAIDGIANPDTCPAMGAAADVVRAGEGCDETVVPPAQIFDSATNPGGIRCTLWDSLVNVYGRDPETGYARRTIDNVGVQYGLVALGRGDITLKQFIDLNEGIGGFDDDGEPRPARSLGDSEALAAMHRTGRINTGAGGLPDVPIIDVRSYVDDNVNIHQYINSYITRARLQRANGTSANHVMFRGKGPINVNPMRAAALDVMGTWLDAIESDRSARPMAEKVIAAKPAAAVDACWTDGQRTNGPAVIGAANLCESAYPPHSGPAQQAGRPLDSLAFKCQLKPLSMSDYGSPGGFQQARLTAIFPGGVCDWSKPGVGEQALAGTWQEFGPERVVDRRKRTLRLKLRERGSKKRARTQLTATMRPCPAVSFQRVVFEQKRRGKWRKIGAGVLTGKRCRARESIRIKGRSAKLRVRAEAIDGYRGVRSKSRG